MNEPGKEPADNNSEASVVYDYYESHKETQREVFQIYARKTGWMIMVAGIVYLISYLIALAAADAFLLPLLVQPVLIGGLFIGLGFFARKQPMPAAGLAAAVYLVLNVMTVIQSGAIALLAGWLIKAIIITVLLLAFNYAREANQARKESNQ
jgi:uncharacterized membrane protein